MQRQHFVTIQKTRVGLPVAKTASPHPYSFYQTKIKMKTFHSGTINIKSELVALLVIFEYYKNLSQLTPNTSLDERPAPFQISEVVSTRWVLCNGRSGDFSPPDF